MQRRDFLTAGTLSALTLTSSLSAADSDTTETAPGGGGLPARQWIEIRTYWAADEIKKGELVEKIDSLVIPCRNRAGFEPVGVFTVDRNLHQNDHDYHPRFDRAVLVVTASTDLSALIGFPRKAAAERTAGDFINQNPAELCYVDQTTELLFAFHGFPALDVPNLSPDRVLQLRRYNSMNDNRNLAKIRMFDGRGELPLFQRCGMNPVFFGETLFGDMMPSLTYMLSFENEGVRQAGWKKFVDSPEWKEMSAEKEFQFTATRIRNLCLRPSPGSQI